MDVLLRHQKAEIYVQHNSCVCYEDMLHVEILVRFVFVPDEISYEPTHYKSVFAELLQKIAVFFKYLVRDSVSCHDQVLGVVLGGSPLETRSVGSGLGLAVYGGEVGLLE